MIIFLTCNLVSISDVQHRDSVINVHPFFLVFFPMMADHRTLNRLPSRTFFIHPVYNSLHMLIPNPQALPPLPIHLLLVSHESERYVSLFLLCRYVHLYHILHRFLDMKLFHTSGSLLYNSGHDCSRRIPPYYSCTSVSEQKLVPLLKLVHWRKYTSSCFDSTGMHVYFHEQVTCKASLMTSLGTWW